ncbi:MAG: ABC transporter permease, partial [Rhodospirillaceae bacterium]
LPSVVLGFIAALILAPIVETWIAAVILAFVAIPAGLFFSAYLWQLLPSLVALRLGGVPKFSLMFVSVFIFGLAAYQAGSAFEGLFFAGDLKAWANGDIGSSAPFTTLLVFPFIFLAVYIGSEGFMSSTFGAILKSSDRVRAGMTDMGRWVVTLVIAGALSYLAALLLIGVGLDPRGGVID